MSEYKNYIIITNEDGNQILNSEGFTLIQNVKDKTLMYANIETQSPSNENSVPLQNYSGSSQEDDGTDTTKSDSNRWTHDAIVALTMQYKRNIKQFQSSTIRNEAVWKKISGNLKEQNLMYTAKQCDFKFKNLKKKYHAKVDNMKATASGAAAIRFEYFELFDEIFGRKPNVVPLAIASSSRGVGIESEVDVKDENILEKAKNDENVNAKKF